MTTFGPTWLLITDVFIVAYLFYRQEEEAKDIEVSSLQRKDPALEPIAACKLLDPLVVDKTRRKLTLLIIIVFAIRVYSVFHMNTAVHDYEYEVEVLKGRVAELTIEVNKLQSDLKFSSLLRD